METPYPFHSSSTGSAGGCSEVGRIHTECKEYQEKKKNSRIALKSRFHKTGSISIEIEDMSKKEDDKDGKYELHSGQNSSNSKMHGSFCSRMLSQQCVGKEPAAGL